MLLFNDYKKINPAHITQIKGQLFFIKSLFVNEELAKKNIRLSFDVLKDAQNLYHTQRDSFNISYWYPDMSLCMFQFSMCSKFDSTFYFYKKAIKYLRKSIDSHKKSAYLSQFNSINIASFNLVTRYLTNPNSFERLFSTTIINRWKNNSLLKKHLNKWKSILQDLKSLESFDSLRTLANSTSYSNDILNLKNAIPKLKKYKKPIAVSYAKNSLAFLLLHKSLFASGDEISSNLYEASTILKDNLKSITKLEYPHDWAKSKKQYGFNYYF